MRVQLRHRTLGKVTNTNLIANARGVPEAVAITETDKLGHIMPPCHSFRISYLVLCWLLFVGYNVHSPFD